MEASVPNNYCCDYYSSDELGELQIPMIGGGGDGIGRLAASAREKSSLPFYDNNNGQLLLSSNSHNNVTMIPAEESGLMLPINSMFPYNNPARRLLLGDMVVPSLPEFNVVSSSGKNGSSKGCFAARRDHHQLPELFGAAGFSSSTFCPLYDPVAGDTWGGNQGRSVPDVEEPTMKIGRYSVEERKDRILRYLKKRNQRNFNKTIKYACRKTLADKRVRIRGRFAKNNETCDQDEILVHTNINPQEAAETDFYYHDPAQIKHDEEDWLQEAMASLMYFPYVNIAG